MESFKYIINNTNNIHARPLSELAKIAKDSECDVTIIKDNTSKDIKKIIGIMQLGLKEYEAKKNILNFFKTNF